MPRYHSYKHKPGGYFRGRSRFGRYYTRKAGCVIPMALFLLLMGLALVAVAHV